VKQGRSVEVERRGDNLSFLARQLTSQVWQRSDCNIFVMNVAILCVLRALLSQQFKQTSVFSKGKVPRFSRGTFFVSVSSPDSFAADKEN